MGVYLVAGSLGRFFKELGNEIAESYRKNYTDTAGILEQHFIFHCLPTYDFVTGKKYTKAEKILSDAFVYGTYHTGATIGTAIKVPRIIKTSFKQSLSRSPIHP